MGMIRRRTCVLGMLAGLMITLVSCEGDRARGLQQIGATIDPDTGMPAAVVYPCPGQAVSAVALWLMNKSGSDRERQLWGVTRSGSAPTSTTRVAVGQTPHGFREDVPLMGQLPSDAGLQFVVQVGGSVTVGFRLSDLRRDGLLVDPAWFGNRRQVTMGRFEQENAKDCRPG